MTILAQEVLARVELVCDQCENGTLPPCSTLCRQLLVCPNARHHHNFISAYLCVPDYEGAQAGIRRTQFELVLENKDPEKTVRRSRRTSHPSLMSLSAFLS